MTEIKVLDHGYVKLVESWGSDDRIIEAARMSTGKGFQGWGPKHDEKCARSNGDNLSECMCKSTNGDEKLLRFLYENAHATPFEMAGLIVEVQAPIFVFREWHRHRTQSYNEMSARYTPLPDVNYVPSVERLMMNARGSNKQANRVADAPELTELGAEGFQRAICRQYEIEEQSYQAALACGVPKELARLHLSVGRYSRMRASANLRNWLAFLTLRMAPNAQYEIRVYANAIASMLRMSFPRTMELFDAHR